MPKKILEKIWQGLGFCLDVLVLTWVRFKQLYTGDKT